MSDAPTGPWTTMGYLMQPNDASSGNHPGIVDFRGRSYLFGFNYALNFAETDVHRERRSICVDELHYAEDGTIPELPWWDSTGAAQIASLDPYVQTEAETIAWSMGVKAEPCSEGGMNISNINDGDFIKVSGAGFRKGASSFEARVASAATGGNIEIRLDGESGTLIGACAVPGTGGWQSWQTVSCDVDNVEGFHDIYFKFTGTGDSLFNFNWWKFTP
jgi:hypothetical protein